MPSSRRFISGGISMSSDISTSSEYILDLIYEIISKEPQSIEFDVNEYLARRPAVATSGMDATHHFVYFGIDQEEWPHPYYSKDWHAEINNVGSKGFAETILHLAKTRSDPKRLKVAFFGYAWNSARLPDPYQRAVIAALAELGLNVDVYIGGHFAQQEATKGLRSYLRGFDVAGFLRLQQYDFAISFNNSMILPETVAALSCKIVSIIVDSDHHLFDHTGSGLYEAFKLPIHAAPIYRSLIEDLAEMPNLQASMSFIPAATEINGRKSAAGRESIEISWIASIVGDHNLDAFTSRVDHEVPDGLKLVHRCLVDIEKTGEISDDPLSQEAVSILCEWSHWDYALLEMHLQEIVTNSQRLAVVERLAPLGLKLFGNARWRKVLGLSPALVQSFQSGDTLRTHADLCAIYDRSKISVNLPQIQAGTGMQYRILDILASNSLLITKHIPNSDMEELFGSNSPIVTFSDIDDLKTKCEFYLKNDSARISRINACNELVSNGYSFKDRAMEHLRLSNEKAASEFGETTGRGSMTLIWPEKVLAWAHTRDAGIEVPGNEVVS
jgi:hypothetical protein